jgi:hypothetical protein
MPLMRSFHVERSLCAGGLSRLARLHRRVVLSCEVYHFGVFHSARIWRMSQMLLPKSSEILEAALEKEFSGRVGHVIPPWLV